MRAPELLRRPGYRRLLVGQTVSSFGDWLATFALMALVLDLTGSPVAVGGILALRLLPSLVGGPLATGVSRRLDRRRTMVAMDAVRAGLVLLVPIVDALWWVYTLAFAIELASLVFLPARDASVPDLVDDDQLPAANGLVLVTSFANIPVGAAAFAGLVALPSVVGGVLSERPYAVVFAVDALTYLVSLALIRTLDIAGSDETAVAGDASGSELAAFLGAFQHPLIRSVLPGLSTVVLGAGALFSLGIVYVQDVLGATRTEFGFLIAFFGLGAGIAVAWLQLSGAGTSIDVVRTGVVAMGAVLMTMSLVSSLLLAYASSVLFGAAGATALVGGISFLQEQLAGRQRVLAFTAFHVTMRAGLSLSALAAGLAAEHLPAASLPLVGDLSPTALVMFGAGVLIVLGGLAMIAEPIRPLTERPAR